jgi:hypothetical protein
MSSTAPATTGPLGAIVASSGATCVGVCIAD